MRTEEAERPVLLSARTTINDSFQMFRGKNQAQHHLGFQLYDLYVIIRYCANMSVQATLMQNEHFSVSIFISIFAIFFV